jgi:hypothetical protein
LRCVREFVAEQYVSRTDGAAVERDAGAAGLVAEQLTGEGTPIEFVGSVFVPADETCIYIYEADSIETMRAALARTPLRFERVSEAVTRSGRPTGTTGRNK